MVTLGVCAVLESHFGSSVCIEREDRGTRLGHHRTAKKGIIYPGRMSVSLVISSVSRQSGETKQKAFR